MKKLKSLKTFSGACWWHTHTHNWKSWIWSKALLKLSSARSSFWSISWALIADLSERPTLGQLLPQNWTFMLKMQYRAVDTMAMDGSDFQQPEFQSVCIYISLFALCGAETWQYITPWFWGHKGLVRQDNKTFPHLYLVWNSCEKLLPGSLVGISTGLWLNRSYLKNMLLCLWFLKLSLIFSILFLHSSQRELGFFRLDIFLSLSALL